MTLSKNKTTQKKIVRDGNTAAAAENVSLNQQIFRSWIAHELAKSELLSLSEEEEATQKITHRQWHFGYDGDGNWHLPLRERVLLLLDHASFVGVRKKTDYDAGWRFSGVVGSDASRLLLSLGVRGIFFLLATLLGITA